MRILVPFGTRPEVVKLAPVVRALADHGHEVRSVATGQHGDPRLADEMFAELDLAPDVRWVLPDGEAARVGALLTHAYEELSAHPPEVVLALGDTHTVPLFALAARRFNVPLVHVEAGLRSFNDRSLEEGHRRVAGSLAMLHLAPTPLAASLLEVEGVEARRIAVVGNPITDTLAQVGPPRVPVADRRGVVITAHRATNVDDPVRLSALVDCILRLSRDVGPVTFPVHPRTESRLREFGLHAVLEANRDVCLVPPLAYGPMLRAVAAARVVVTDSGGLQEEASWLGVPVVVLRSSTPRWEGVMAGTAALVGLDSTRAVGAALRFTEPAEQARIAAEPCPYGDGRVGPRIAALLDEPEIVALLELHEPDFASGGLPDLVASA